MNSENIIETSITELPAPYWFLQFFKVFGFTLHIIPMNILYAGTLLALILRVLGNEYNKTLSNRLMKHMPIIVAYAVNFGIIPLLFLQVAYYKVFYSATILMAWLWWSMVILLIIAYYGIYVYNSGIVNNGAIKSLQKIAGWVAAIIFIYIGFIFSNAFSLMTDINSWYKIWQKTDIAGATTGFALNLGNSTFARWLMMFGLAITTTAVFIIVDTILFATKEGDQYKQNGIGLALKIYTIGAMWFGITGMWYIFGTFTNQLKTMMFSSKMIILTILTATSPVIPWLLMLIKQKNMTKKWVVNISVAQVMVLILNAISRQIVQNAELDKFFNVRNAVVNLQLGPLILFLVSLIIGIGIIVYMVRKITEVKEGQII